MEKGFHRPDGSVHKTPELTRKTDHLDRSEVLPPGFEPESLTCFREAISPRRKANMIDRTTLRERI